MNILEIKSVFQNAVQGETRISIELKEDDAQKLRNALEVVQNYENAACDAMGDLDPRKSEWYNIQYAVEYNKVIVIAKDGMIG